jgi:hypothetical protein
VRGFILLPAIMLVAPMPPLSAQDAALVEVSQSMEAVIRNYERIQSIDRAARDSIAARFLVTPRAANGSTLDSLSVPQPVQEDRSGNTRTVVALVLVLVIVIAIGITTTDLSPS